MDISDKIANEMPILSVYSHSVFFASRIYIVNISLKNFHIHIHIQRIYINILSVKVLL